MKPGVLQKLRMDKGSLPKKQLNSIQSKCLIGKSIMAINQARLKTSKWNLLNVYIIAHAFGFP